MSAKRYSIELALASARATRTNTARAARKHARDETLGRQLGRALRASWVLVDELERALARAKHVKRRAVA